MLERWIEENFMAPQHRQMWTIIDNAAQAMEAIQQAPQWNAEAIQFATLT